MVYLLVSKMPFLLFSSKRKGRCWAANTLIIIIIIWVITWIYRATGLTSREFGASPKFPTSKCGFKADKRGAHQRVVSYSLYGNLSLPEISRRYLKTFVQTSLSFPSKYPGWTMRIYHDYNAMNDRESLEILEKQFGDSSEVTDHVDLCSIRDVEEATKIPTWYERTWRFLPLLDEHVDVFLSRDSDIFIHDREVEAVREWLESNLTFHSMRDHPQHCIPMLGGMWGVKLYRMRHEVRRAASVMFSRHHPQINGYDQDILREFIWPIAQYTVISHDSYCCDWFDPPLGSASIVKAFPTRRKGNEFVGGLPEGNRSECPLKCRPAAHKDWRFC